MYFRSTTPITESFSFTIKNLNDIFTVPADNVVKYTEEKLKRVEKEFNIYYKYDDETEDEILLAIGKIIKENKCDVIDIEKMDRIHHIRLYYQLEDKTLSKTDYAKFYTVLFREVFVPSLPHYYSKYTLLKFIKNRFMVFITFDEEKIAAVHTLVSENQIDIMSEIQVKELKLNMKVFQKVKND